MTKPNTDEDFPETLGPEAIRPAVPTDLADAHYPAQSEWGTASPVAPTAVLRGHPVSAKGGGHPTVVPGYEVVRELGRGGMGVVYQARQLSLDRVVALKMILSGSHAGPAELLRFRIEAESIARLQHPNVVQIYEVGEHNGLPYFSLEFCPGGSLDRKINGTPLPPLQAATVVSTIARGMQAAHDKGVIHRDLKPGNVLLLADGTPKVTDFGLAKRLDDSSGQTHSGALMGTPSYMPPEQAQGKKDIGPPADIYALGAILYECLTGRPPFRATTVMDTLAQVVEQDPPPPARLQSTVPRDLEIICLKCLAKEPSRRYASSAALAEDLDRFVKGEPILARPVSQWERAVKWARRNPSWAGLGVALSVLFLAVMTSFVFYGLYQSQQARIYREENARLVQAEKVRDEVKLTLFRARRHETEGDWPAAKAELDRALATVDAQPDLHDHQLREEVAERLAAADRQVLALTARMQALQKCQRFAALRDDALFYETHFTGMDTEANRAKARVAVLAALALYGLDAENARETGDLQTVRSLLPANEFATLTTGCYELLLVLASVEAPDRTNTGPKAKTQATTALRQLERARKLGQAYQLDTQAFHLMQARYQAIARGESTPDVPGMGSLQNAPPEPTGAVDWFMRAIELYRAGQFADAAIGCRKTLDLQPDHFWARYVQGLCLLREKRWVEARAALTVCISRRSDFPWARLLRGFASSELGFKYKEPTDFTAAEADFNQSVANVEASQRSAPGSTSDPSFHYAALVNRGVLFIRQQKFDRAVADLKAASKLIPGRHEAHVNLSQALQACQDHRGALLALDQAIHCKPDLAVLYESRARLHLAQREKGQLHLAAARADFEQAVQKDTGNPPQRLVANLTELGKLLDGEGKYEQALARFDAALKLQPDFAAALRYQAETLLALNRRAEAGAALDRYLKRTQQPSAAVYQARGLLHAWNSEYAQAVELYTLSLRLNPNDVQTRAYRGWTYLLMGAARPALADFEGCLTREPSNADALAGRGNAHVRLRELGPALDDAEAALKHGEEKDRLLYNVACIYALAAAQLQPDATGRNGQRSLGPTPSPQLARCEKLAVECLTRTLQATPENRRKAFWNDQVARDPALDSIRRTTGYRSLRARYQ